MTISTPNLYCFYSRIFNYTLRCDKNQINALRNLISRLKSKEIELGTELNKEVSLKVCMSAAKQIRYSIEQFKNANRMDLIEKEEIELGMIENYLPKQMSEQEIVSIIQGVINETNAQSPSDMGKVMGPVMKKVAGKADGKIVQTLVLKELNL